jgi:hypothetical protein
MSDIAIRVENLSKRYRIGAAHRHDTLRDALVATLQRSNVSRGWGMWRRRGERSPRLPV